MKGNIITVDRKLKKENQRRAPYELPKLAKEANKYHYKVRRHWFGLAENARKSGEALIKARYCGLWRRGEWTRWLQDNFDGSYETAKVYIKIAKKWEDPKLKEARKCGVTLDSINKILQVLSGKRKPDGKLDVDVKEVDYCWDYIRKMFAKKLRTELTKDDILIFAQEDIFDYLWDRLAIRLHDIVCGALGFDPYENEKKGTVFYEKYRADLQAKKQARRKVNVALNRRSA